MGKYGSPMECLGYETKESQVASRLGILKHPSSMKHPDMELGLGSSSSTCK